MDGFGVRSVLCAAVCAAVVLQGVAWAEPTIEITSVPVWGTLGSLTGKVSGVTDYENYAVATYIQPEGQGWWTKPYFSPPTVPVDANGNFTVNVTTGGAGSFDPYATLYCVNLMEAGGTPPQAAALCHQPDSPLFLANDTYERYARTIAFSGRTWDVKDSPIATGPGPNRFSSTDVSVDPAGKMHLTIQQHDGDWYCTEVALDESLGYGRYLFQTSSRVDNLDGSAIFGAFLWDAYGDATLPAGRCNREVDFEDGIWPPLSPALDSQFVVQPYDTLGNREQFTLPDLGGDADLTRILTWGDGYLCFVMLRGHFGLGDNYTQSDVVAQWRYVEDPSQGHYVPDPARERFRFNLWLRGGEAPVGDGTLEAVIDAFDYAAPGDVNGDGKVDGGDLALWQQHYDPLGANTDAQFPLGDFNGDGKVDGGDLAIWQQNYHPLGISPYTVSSIPEPATLLIVVGGLGMMMLRRRR